MARTPRPWTVTRHGPIERIDENLWAVEGNVPGIPGLTRRMCIVRRPDGTLLFYNAVPVNDSALAEIHALGEPRDLVIPQNLHMIDAHAFRAKLGVRVYAPAVSRMLVSQRVQVDGALEDLPKDATVTAGTVAGFTTGEGFVTVHTGPRVSLLFADVVLNLRRRPGLLGLLFHVMGFTGDRPNLPVPVRLRVLRDRVALRNQLQHLASLPGLVRIVPSHGAIIDQDPSAVLLEIAATL